MSSSNNTKSSIWAYMPVTILAAVFCCTLWGSASPSIKIGYELFGIPAGDTPARILFAGVRFIIAGIMVIVAGSILQRKFLKPNRSTMKYVLVLSMCQTFLQYIFFYMALAHTSGVRGSLINAAGTFFSILLAVYIFKFEKLSLKKAIGTILGFLGVSLVVTGGSLSFAEGGISFQGEGAMLIAAFASAIAGCFIKLYSKYENPVTLSGYQFLIGGILMTVIGYLTGGRIYLLSAACIPLLLYMGFISAGAYTIWGILLKYNPVSTVTVLGFINPLMGVVLSAIFLHEQNEAFSAIGLSALALICVGIFIVNYTPKKKS